MKLIYKNFLISLLILFTCNISFAQTTSSVPRQDSLHVYIGSGINQLLIPLPVVPESENAEVVAVSSDTELLQVIQATHNENQPFIIVEVQEKGTGGSVNLTVDITGEEEPITVIYKIQIGAYHNPGLNFEVHDIIFWQEAVPLNGSPIHQMVISNSEGPYEDLNYDDIPLTVGMDCSGAVCTGHDFFTAFYKGYIVPPADGTYHFYMRSGDKHALWLSNDENYQNAARILARTTSNGSAGTEIGNNTTKSEPVELEAGKVYAIYGTQWIIHSTYGGIMWDGPGMEMDFIPGEYLMPVYDIEKPSAPADLVVEWRTSSEGAVKWEPSTDNGKVSGYNIYVNGIRENSTLLNTTTYRVEELTEETSYYIAVTAVDQAGNESQISNIAELTTYQNDTNPPLPPQEITLITATGLALHLEWDKGSDAETEVIGYNVYINDELYNTDDIIFEQNIVIHNLAPETAYSITIESVDAGKNLSDKSETFAFSTVAFDPTGPSLGEHTGKLVVYNNNTSWNEGIGLNGPYENGSMVTNAEIQKLVTEFEPGVIRWGAISANSKSFEGSTGTGKSNTYGNMLNFANELGARFALTVGVQPGIDYRTDPNTFLHLLEYLAGDESTTWGAVRASEGYTEPLLQQGKGILLEFGNEVWGGEAHDASFGSDYSTYAKWAREMSDVVRSSPYYDPEKIIMVYSGRYPHPDQSYGINTNVFTGDRGHIESYAVSGYLGGNLNYDPEIPMGDSELSYYKNGISMTASNMEGLILTMKQMLSMSGSLKTFYLYESNMTTTSYNGRFGQAIVMTDYLINSMNYGSIVPTIFHLTGGQWRITRPAEDYKRLPFYHTGQFFNRFGKGHILETEFISNNKLTNAGGQNINYDPVGAYAFNNKDSFAVVLINRDFEHDFTVQVELPADLTFSENAKMYTIWNDDFSSFETNIDSVAVTLSEDLLITVPKHAMVVVAIQGSDPGYEQLPLGYFEREHPETMEVTSTRNFIIDTNRGSDVIQAIVLPTDAFSTDAILDVIENTTQSILTPRPEGKLHIKASGVCGDDGYILLHVYASDNHELSDTVKVQVINQGIDCPVTSSDLIDIDKRNYFYPNPASDVIKVNSALDSKTYVQLFDDSGRVVFQNYLNKGYEIDVSSLRPGLYLISFLKSDGTYIQDKLIIK